MPAEKVNQKSSKYFYLLVEKPGSNSRGGEIKKLVEVESNMEGGGIL